MKRKNIYMTSALLAGLGLTAAALGGPLNGILAYMTDTADVMENNFTIALDVSPKPVEDFIPNDNVINGPVMSFTKVIQVANTCYLDEYVRVRLTFSDSSIESMTQFSWDGVNYYSVADYKNHLPDGWVYNEEDKNYYYTKVLYAQNWEETKEKLEYRDETGGMYYKKRAADNGIIQSPCLTTPLVRYVKTTFPKASDIRSYSIDVSTSATADFWGDDYKSAWETFEEMKKD